MRSPRTSTATTLVALGAMLAFAGCKKASSAATDAGNGHDAQANNGGPDAGENNPADDGGTPGGNDDGSTGGGQDTGEVAPNAPVTVSGKLVDLGEYLARVTYSAPAAMDGGGATDAGLADTSTKADGGGRGDVGLLDSGPDAGGGDAAGGLGDAADAAGGGGGDGGGGGGGSPIGVGGASLLALGITPPATTVTSNVDPTKGDFTLTIPQNGKTVLFANKLGYNPSYTALAVQAVNLTGAKAFIAPNAYVNQLAASYQIDLTTPFRCHGPPVGSLSPNDNCVFGVIVGRILDDGSKGAQLPVEGIKTTDFDLLGGEMNGTWYHRGPFFLTSTGTPSLNALASIVTTAGDGALRGGLFVTFVEIPQLTGPPGVDFSISIHHDAGGNLTRYFGPQVVTAFRPYAVSFTTILETGAPPPPPVVGVDFATQVYPLFLPVAQGGLGCLGCHTSVGGVTPASGMDLSGGPAIAYMKALDPMKYTQRVNLMNPAASLILVNPLYNPAGNTHPIIAYTSTQDPAYKTILQWITEGAKPSGGTTHTSSAVSFSMSVAPIFQNSAQTGGAGCVVCHSTQGGQIPQANFNVGTTPAQLYQALVNQPATDQTTGQRFRIDKVAGDEDKSLVLTKPLQGNPAIHPVKLFSSSTDPRWQIIYRWIAEGYQQN